MVEYKTYNKDFYSDQEISSYQSAKVLLPIIFDLFRPASVVDVGCGIGAWLKVWSEDLKIEDFYGIEAPFILKEMLIVDPNKVLLTDLNMPVNIGKRFELAMSLEVAEHIEPISANIFVKNLTELSDVVIFSAAIPGQEGTFHVNEQFPEYWEKLFRVNGYSVVDCIRKSIWFDKRINYWYRQNILVFIKENKITTYPRLMPFIDKTDADFLTRIHPELLQYKSTIIKKLNSPLGYIRMQLHFLKIWVRKKIR